MPLRLLRVKCTGVNHASNFYSSGGGGGGGGGGGVRYCSMNGPPPPPPMNINSCKFTPVIILHIVVALKSKYSKTKLQRHSNSNREGGGGWYVYEKTELIEKAEMMLSPCVCLYSKRCELSLLSIYCHTLYNCLTSRKLPCNCR